MYDKNSDTFLLIDTDKKRRDHTRSLLDKLSPKTILDTDSVEKATEISSTNGISLIVAELNDPVDDCFSFLHNVRSNAALQTIPFLIVSEFSTMQNLTRAIGLQATDFLRRPIDDEEFVTRISEIISDELPEHVAKAKILLVDDIPSALKVLRRAMEISGFQNLIEAVDGKSTLEAIENEKLDLVLLDWDLPDMKGMEILKHIRSKPELSKLAVVMITAYTDDDLIVEAVLAGASGYILKPFDRNALRAKVLHVLRYRNFQFRTLSS